MTARSLMMALTLVALAFVLSALAGCGGGGEQENTADADTVAAGRATVQPVFCNASGVCQ